jgi:hypothetical protein
MENAKESKLPSLKDLISSDLKLPEINQLNVLLNQPPPQKWLKKHPIAKNVVYLPIERIEYLLYKIFIRWRVEVKSVQLVGNAVCVTIRLHYFNPVSSEWEFQDGVGASPLQTKKDAKATDFSMLQTNAVVLAAPAAKTEAVKDAAGQIGAIFGKDLNRADKISYDNLIENNAFDNQPKEDKHAKYFEDEIINENKED